MAGEKNFWIKDKEEGLIKHYEKGLSYKELAKKYNVSVASVRSQLYTYRKEGLIGIRGRKNIH